MTQGVLIFAHNNDSSERDYLFSAWVCAKTIKNQSPNVSVSLFTRSKDYVELQHIDIYDHILEFPFGDAGHEDNNTLTNLYQIYYATPYEQTLVLDADTLVLGKLDGMFSAARRHDLLFPHTIKNFKGIQYSVQNKLIEKNNLPKFETSVWYFNKDFDKKKEYRWEGRKRIELDSSEEDSEPFFNLLEIYLRNHKFINEQFS